MWYGRGFAGVGCWGFVEREGGRGSGQYVTSLLGSVRLLAGFLGRNLLSIMGMWIRKKVRYSMSSLRCQASHVDDGMLDSLQCVGGIRRGTVCGWRGEVHTGGL